MDIVLRLRVESVLAEWAKVALEGIVVFDLNPPAERLAAVGTSQYVESFFALKLGGSLVELEAFVPYWQFWEGHAKSQQTDVPYGNDKSLCV